MPKICEFENCRNRACYGNECNKDDPVEIIFLYFDGFY